ncbi:MFS transporter [Rhodococcus hoagii]|nr:MFS transporter [Prescottella equi]
MGGADAHPDRLPRRSCRRAIDRLRHQTCAEYGQDRRSRVDRIERHHGRHGGRASRFHFIAGRWNWQATFYILGAAALAVFALSLLTLAPRSAASAADNAQDLRNLRLPSLWARYLVSFLTIGAAYAAFSYFTPLLEDSAGFGADATTLILLAYGLCALVGNLIVGSWQTSTPSAFCDSAMPCCSSHSACSHSRARPNPWFLTMVLVVGLAGVSMNPPLVTRVVEIGAREISSAPSTRR